MIVGGGNQQEQRSHELIISVKCFLNFYPSKYIVTSEMSLSEKSSFFSNFDTVNSTYSIKK